MYHFIFPTKDSWISSGSNKVTGVTETDQNFGKDQILEVKKFFYNSSFDSQTRALVDFSGTEFTEMSKSVAGGSIVNPTYYLRLYEAEGNAEISGDYTLDIKPISQSWTEGTGKFGDNPKNTNGISWDNRSNPIGGSEVTWSNDDGTRMYGVSVHNISSSTQTFSNQSSDVEVDVTNMVNGWLNGALDNNGMLLRFTGSQETDSTTFGQLKFFSSNTNTIYPPRLEVRWDDHLPCTGSNTGSLNQITMSGHVDNYLYMKNLRESYRETEKVKFRVGSRKQFIQKNFSTSVQTVTGSYIPEGSGSYSIVDITTGETVVPFGAHTSMSCDPSSNYFIQWMNGFYPDRMYKIMYRVKYNDGQEIIYDDDFEFILRT